MVSAGGDNHFPFIDADPDAGDLVDVDYTHRFDPVFHNRQDVELDHLSPSGAVLRRERITPFSNETEADPVLGGTFIGDYIGVASTSAAGRVAPGGVPGSHANPPGEFGAIGPKQRPAGCVGTTCEIQAAFSSSTDNGQTWTARRPSCDLDDRPGCID